MVGDHNTTDDNKININFKSTDAPHAQPKKSQVPTAPMNSQTKTTSVNSQTPAAPTRPQAPKLHRQTPHEQAEALKSDLKKALARFRPLDNIEDVEEFYAAIDRTHLTKSLSDETPYTYWSIELYDQKNGIRGGGGLGVLAADMRRTAERMNVPFVLLTPFYPSEQHQKCVVKSATPDPAYAKNETASANPETAYAQNETASANPETAYAQNETASANPETAYAKNTQNFEISNETISVQKDYHDFGFDLIGSVDIKCNGAPVKLDVLEKDFGSTRIISITEPGFGELYSGESGGDHRLFQEVALGFGGYKALKLAGLKPAIIQLNEVATFFAAAARLDELVSNGMDLYEAIVYTRKHTIYTNHTLVQAAEATFCYDQFERFVFPNLKSKAVQKWLSDKFENGQIRLSTVTIEIAELRSGVSKLHARVANYHDLAGRRVKFQAITNGIDIPTWVSKPIISEFRELDVIDKFYLPTLNYEANLEKLTAEKIRILKAKGRAELNAVLSHRVDQYGKNLEIPAECLLFDFKRRFVDYKRPWLPFSNPETLRRILEENNAHYILSGRVHEGDSRMFARLKQVLETIDSDPILKARVHYLPDYDEELGRALALGANVSLNTPIVGLEACGTSWMKDIANLGLLISTHDGGVADCPADSYLSITGKDESTEIASLYSLMIESINIWQNDFDLEFAIRKELAAYLPIISGTRMLRDYLNYLF